MAFPSSAFVASWTSPPRAELDKRLTEACQTNRSVVVSMAQLTFMDSSGLHVLARASQQLAQRGWRLILADVPQAVERILTVTGMADVFAVSSTEAEALKMATLRSDSSG